MRKTNSDLLAEFLGWVAPGMSEAERAALVQAFLLATGRVRA